MNAMAAGGTHTLSFFAEQRERTADLWRRSFAHPFVRGIAEGTLDRARFQFYLAQDDHFLVDYARVLALAVVKAPDRETMGRFSRMVDTIINTEMALHRQFSARYGVSEAQLEATPIATTTRAYTDHLLRVAWGGTIGELVAAILPCHYGYLELARSLLEEPGARAGAAYAEWIAAYASDAYAEGAEWVLGLGNRLAAEAGPQERQRMALAYTTSLRYELAFWEMSWLMAGADA